VKGGGRALELRLPDADELAETLASRPAAWMAEA